MNTASLAMSRLAMSHYAENSNKNDIVGELGITGVGFGGPARWGAPYFNVQGYSPFGDSWLATPCTSWDTIVEGRDTLSWQNGRHSLKFGGSYRRFIWPMWALSRAAATTSSPTASPPRRQRTTAPARRWPASCSDCRPRGSSERRAQMNLRQWYADAFAQDTWRITPQHHHRYRAALRVHARAGRHLAELEQPASAGRQADGLHRRPERDAARADVPEQARFRARASDSRITSTRPGLVFRAAYGIFYTPVDMNTWCNQLHNVPFVFPVDAAERQLHARHQRLQLPAARAGHRPSSASPAFDPHPPAQYIQQWSASVEKSLGHDTTLEVGYHGEHGLPSAAVAPDQQCRSPGPG